jgi:hypothetical protein
MVDLAEKLECPFPLPPELSLAIIQTEFLADGLQKHKTLVSQIIVNFFLTKEQERIPTRI